MLRSRPRPVLGALLAGLAAASPLRASADEPGWTDRLVRGTSTGDPSTGKTAMVAGLYGAAAVSLATGVVFTLRARDAGNEADDYRKAAPSDFCDERASDACHSYLELRRAESTRYLYGEAFFGGGAFLLLSGALVAELWPNRAHAPSLSGHVTRDQALLGFSAEF